MTVSPDRGFADVLDAARSGIRPHRVRALATGVGTGRAYADLVGFVQPFVCMNRRRAPVVSLPFMTRTELMTPRYWSKYESKMRACSGASAIAFRRRDAVDDSVEQLGDALPRLAR